MDHAESSAGVADTPGSVSPGRDPHGGHHGASGGWLAWITRVVRLASEQHGLVSSRQARELGAGRGAIAHAVGSGRWTRLMPGVLAVGAPRGTFHERAMAAVLSTEPSWLSHSSAAWLWGWNVRHSRPEVTVNSSRRVSRAGVRVHHSGETSSDHVACRAGIPVTTPARALLDLSGRMPTDELATALDLALTQRAIRLEELVSMLAGLPTGGGRRPAKLARLVEMRQEGRHGDSHLEARVIRLLDASGLPPPVCQHPISLEGRRYRLDLAWPELRRFAETDGFAFHGHRSAFDADRRRQNALVAAGWVGVRITSDFTDREVVSAVRALLDVPAGSMPRPAEDPA